MRTFNAGLSFWRLLGTSNLEVLINILIICIKNVILSTNNLKNIILTNNVWKLLTKIGTYTFY